MWNDGSNGMRRPVGLWSMITPARAIIDLHRQSVVCTHI